MSPVRIFWSGIFLLLYIFFCTLYNEKNYFCNRKHFLRFLSQLCFSNKTIFLNEFFLLKTSKNVFDFFIIQSAKKYNNKKNSTSIIFKRILFSENLKNVFYFFFIIQSAKNIIKKIPHQSFLNEFFFLKTSKNVFYFFFIIQSAKKI